MNENDAILVELKKISAWADLQRKTTKWSLIGVAVVIPLFIAFAIVMEQKTNRSLEQLRSPKEPLAWCDVERKIRAAELNQAIDIGETLIKKTPFYPGGHRTLAGAYLAAGQLEQAKQHYAEACRLFPNKDNESALEAITKRMNGTSHQPPR